MTEEQALQLQPGDEVEVVWTRASLGADWRKGRVSSVKKDGRKIGVRLARVNRHNVPNGGYIKTIHWFYSEEVVRCAD